MTKKQKITLIVLLAALALVLAGCGVQRGPIDPELPADGIWEAIVVFPLTEALIFLNRQISALGIRYSYGWAIILFTLIVKLVTLPLSFTQMRSTRKMQALQPQLKELQKKYAKDRETLSQKQMELYKEAGANPMGGCLPMIIQYPVLIGLYSALYRLAGLDLLTGESFYWIKDLSFPGADVGTKWIGQAWQAKDWVQLATYLSLPLLLVATQIVLQKLTTKSQPTSGDQQQGMMSNMFLVMSVMFGYITLGVPSGLALYWVTSNLLSLLQQYLMVTRFMPATADVVTPKGQSAAEASETLALEAGQEDLVLIKGVGGKTAAVLAAAGIVSYADLAAADEEQLTEIVEEADLPTGDYASWIRQAAKLEREQV